MSRSAPAGEIAVVFDRKNRFLAAGLYDPHGPIRVRLLAHLEPAEVGPNLFRSRLRSALGVRDGILTRDTTGFRILHGENDRMPGLVADRYGGSLVLKLYSAAWLPHLPTLAPILRETLDPERILVLLSRGTRKSAPGFPEPGGLLMGAPPANGIPFLEGGLRFESHPLDGHKTGFYLDQRENRRLLGERVGGGRVLNVFSYTGAFSAYAARGGAREVVDVDRAGPALAQARRHLELNRDDPGVAECRHRICQGNAFDVMQDLARRGELFDTVVVDPPSFAGRRAHRERALSAYGRLTSLALPLIRPEGLLVQASCSARVEADAFQLRIEDAARAAGRPLTAVERTGHPADHPIGFPEGAYLKCLWAQVPG